MCIIVVKDKNKPLPKDKYLKNCFENNPDGAGFMYLKNNQVIIDKGYMTYNSFEKRYRKLCKKFNDFKDLPLIMHFRIGTAGANSKQNTHPYPISDDKRDLHKTYIKTALGLAHNGIIHEYNPSKHEKDINDTQKFIMQYLYPLYKNWSTFYKNEKILNGINSITDSKFAFLDKYGKIKLVGKFETDEDGILYSNSNYQDSWYYNYRYMYDDEYYLPSKYNKSDDTSNTISDYSYDLQLEPTWYYSIRGGEMTLVGDRILIYDYYTELLYEVTEDGIYREIGEEVEIFDENGEEIIL